MAAKRAPSLTRRSGCRVGTHSVMPESDSISTFETSQTLRCKSSAAWSCEKNEYGRDKTDASDCDDDARGPCPLPRISGRGGPGCACLQPNNPQLARAAHRSAIA